MAGVRCVSGVLFSMVVRWQWDGRCQVRVRSVVLYGSEMAVRWQVSGACQEVLFSMIENNTSDIYVQKRLRSVVLYIENNTSDIYVQKVSLL